MMRHDQHHYVLDGAVHDVNALPSVIHPAARTPPPSTSLRLNFKTSCVARAYELEFRIQDRVSSPS